MIAPALSKLAVPIESVQPHPRNEYHEGDVGAIAQSLERFGQVRPIVVQKSTGNILAGNHVWKAANILGWPKVAAAVIDVTDEEGLAYLITDNRTPELGAHDDQGLAEILVELQQAGLLDGTGYDGDDLDDLLALIEEQTGPLDLDGNVDRKGTPADKLGRYQDSATRAIVLEYDLKDFREAVDALGQLRQENGWESNAQAVLALIRGAVTAAA